MRYLNFSCDASTSHAMPQLLMRYLNFSCDASSLGLFDDNNDDDDSNEALLAFDGFILGSMLGHFGPL